MTSKFSVRLSAMAAATAIVLAGGAQAADVLFTITETGETITFMAPKSPTADIKSSVPGAGFALGPVNVIYNSYQYPDDDVTFYNYSDTGGATDAYGLFSLGSSQYYTGDEGSPTFVTGVYDDQYDYASSQSATVTITDVSGVPEPAAWTLMLAGFGGLGGAPRARRAVTA